MSHQAITLSPDVINNPIHFLQFGYTLDSLALSENQYKELGNISADQWKSVISVAVHEHGVAVPKGITIEKPDATDTATTQSILTGIGVAIGVIIIIVGALLGLIVTFAGVGTTFLAGIAVAAAFIAVFGALLSGFLYVLSWLIQPELLSGLEVGGKGGSLFRDNISISNETKTWLFKDYPSTKPTQWEISKIDIWAGNVVDAIQCHWRGKASTPAEGMAVSGVKHGGNGGTKYTFELEPGEYIVRIKCMVGIRVDSIAIETSQKTSTIFGGTGGDRKCILSGPVIGFYGREGVVMDAIGVQIPIFENELVAYGGDGGIPFICDLSDMKRIRRINVWHGSIIDGFQVLWERNDGELVEDVIYGGYPGKTPGGTFSSFELAPGEAITSIDVRAAQYVDQLVFHTNHGNNYSFGGNGGVSRESIQLADKKILAFIGRYTKYIDNFGVLSKPI